MSKIHRGGRSAEGEPLSAGRVEYLEAARARARAKHIRRTVIIVAALTIVILFATGMVGSSIARAKDLVDSVHIALTPASGWPQQTGITDPDTVVPMSGSFVEKGGDSCAVYSLSGTRLNSIQSGYARPATSRGWRAAPRTSTPKPWTAPSRCARWRTPGRWPWSPTARTAPRS